MENLSKYTRFYLTNVGFDAYKYDLDTVTYKEDIPVVYMNFIGDGNCNSFYINKNYLEKAFYFQTYITKNEIEKSIDYEFAEIIYGDKISPYANRYYAISGISNPLEIGKTYMMSSGGKNSSTESTKIYGTNCTVTKTNISKETILKYMNDKKVEHLYIIDSQYKDDTLVYDNKYYMPLPDKSEENNLKYIEVEPKEKIITEKKIRTKPGIDPKTGELYLWADSRKRIELGYAINGDYANRLNECNAFKNYGAICYSLFEKGYSYKKIHTYLIEKGIISGERENEEFSLTNLQSYFYTSGMYYCNHTAEYNYMMASMRDNSSLSNRLKCLTYLQKLPEALIEAVKYKEEHGNKKQELLNSRKKCFEEMEATYDEKIQDNLNNKLKDINNELKSYEITYSHLSIAEYIISKKDFIDDFINNLNKLL